MEIGDGFDSVFNALLDVDNIAASNFHYFSINKCPHFIAMVMYLLANILTGFDDQLFGQSLVPVRKFNGVNNFVFTPTTFLVH